MSFSIAKLVGVSVALLGAASAQASNFTPEVLLSAPRRSEGMPNWNGELVLNTVSCSSMIFFYYTLQWLRTLGHFRPIGSNIVQLGFHILV